MKEKEKKTGREWEAIEHRYVSEYLATVYPDQPSRIHLALGSPQPRRAGRFMTETETDQEEPARRWADAVIVLPDRIILIEGKVKPKPGVVFQLKGYQRLIAHTPDLAEHRHKPIEMVLLCAIEEPEVTELALKHGIQVVVFSPKSLDPYLEKLHPWERTPSST